MIKLNILDVVAIMNLIEYPMHGELARMRNKVVKELESDYNSYFPQRVSILESFAEKDENGKAKKGEKGNYMYAEGEKEKAVKALEDWAKEEKEYDLPGLKVLLEKSDIQMSIADGRIYDEIMTKLETK